MSSFSDSRPRILVCDDEEDVLASARLLFKGEGIDSVRVSRPTEALAALEDEEFDLVLLDLNYSRDTTSGKEGFELIERIRGKNPKLPIVVMTAWATVDIAVNAMRIGANDFITKPWDNERLLSIVRNMHSLSRLQRSEQRLMGENTILREGEYKLDVIAESPVMKELMETIEQVAPSDANILITGENGTGKSVFAKCIHRLSLRSEGPLISVNMAGLSEGLFESELFGHVKGAFTDAKTESIGRYELADGGTLIMDEIGELSLNHQATLLRVLETGEFERLGSSKTRRANVRVISATNANLEQLVQTGAFRQDLYYRLDTVPLRMPSLKERPRDIELLSEMFLEKFAKRYKKAIYGFSDEAKQALASHDWPGNVRELTHVIERAVLLSKGDRVEMGVLGIGRSESRTKSLDEMSLDEVEAYLIRRTMTRCGGNANLAADELGLSRSAFYRRLQKHDL